MPLTVEIVTAERVVLTEEDVDTLVAPGVEGQLGVLPRHAAFMTMLQPGELRLVKGGEETVLAVTGGFLEVRENRVLILADAAERADEIDVARAEAARHRAEETLAASKSGVDLARAEVQLRRALARLEVVERRRRRPGPPRPS
jgi:F-type H+-transporting ATPase subunit epsilon